MPPREAMRSGDLIISLKSASTDETDILSPFFLLLRGALARGFSWIKPQFLCLSLGGGGFSFFFGKKKKKNYNVPFRVILLPMYLYSLLFMAEAASNQYKLGVVAINSIIPTMAKCPFRE